MAAVAVRSGKRFCPTPSDSQVCPGGAHRSVRVAGQVSWLAESSRLGQATEFGRRVWRQPLRQPYESRAFSLVSASATWSPAVGRAGQAWLLDAECVAQAARGAAMEATAQAVVSSSKAAWQLPILRPGGVLRTYRETIKEHPYRSNFVICLVKGVAASIIAQKCIERREEVDRRRVLSMALFSGVFCGCGYHFIFNVISPKVCGVGSGLSSVVSRMFADCIVVFPFLYMTTFTLIDEAVRFGSAGNVASRWKDSVPSAMSDYVKVWPWANMLCFSIIPTELRVSFTAAVSFAWLIVMSLMSR